MDYEQRWAGLYWVNFVKQETYFPDFPFLYGPEYEKGHLSQIWEVG